MSDDGTGNSPSGPRPSGGAGSGPKREEKAVSEIETFQFPATGEPVRTVVVDSEPWFVAADVARILGYRDAHNLTRRLDEEDRGTRSVSTPSGPQDMTVISEPGLFAAILGSQVAGALEFKRWLTREVLPAIRRTGSYNVPDIRTPEGVLAMANMLKDAAEKVVARDRRIAELEPAAAAWDVLASASGDYSVREAAFILNRDPAISTGQGRLFATLRGFGLIDQHNVPYASHSRHVTLRARSYEHPKTGEECSTQQVRVTADGLRYLHRRLGGSGALDLDTPLPLRGVA